MKGRLKKLTAVILSIALLGSAGLFTGLTAFAEVPTTYTEINEGQSVLVETNSNTPAVWFKFVAPITAEYRFYSKDKVSGDPKGYLYDVNGNQVADNDDGAENGNFTFSYNIAAGAVYYLKAGVFSTSYGTYTVSIEHKHLDNDDDGVCDIEGCGYVLWGPAEADVPFTASIPADEDTVVASFTPAADGWYEITAESKTNNSGIDSWLVGPDGNEPEAQRNGENYAYYLSQGTTYKAFCYCDYSVSNAAVTIASTHLHTDENDDGVCDIEGCGYVLWTKITLNVPVSVKFEGGNVFVGCFIPEEDGWYEFAAKGKVSDDYVSTWASEYSTGDPADYEENGNGYAFNLQKGVKYAVYANCGSSISATVTVKAVHLHTDENNDGVCDVPGCGYVLFTPITLNVPVTFTTEGSYTLTGIFTPAADGLYEFNLDYNKNNNYADVELYDPLSDSYPYYAENGENYAYTLEGGKKYEVYVYSDYGSGYDMTLTAKATHIHTDENDDGVCDVPGCGYTFWVTLTVDVPKDVNVSTDYTLVAHFTPEATGWYAIDAQNKTNSKKAEGFFENPVNYEYTDGRYIAYLESGTEYAVYLGIYNYSGEDITVTITATTGHIHVDDNDDGVCDVPGCGYEFFATFADGVPVKTVTEDNYYVVGRFTPAKDGWYDFETVCTGANYVYAYPYDTLNDGYPEYADNGKNGAYLLESGKTYEVYVYSSNGMGYPVTVTVSSTHLHTDEDEDGVCDVPGCGYVLWATITENVPVRIVTEEYNNFIGCFTPAADGLYEFDTVYNENNNYVYAELYDPSIDDYLDYVINGEKVAYNLEGGKRYNVIIYSDNGRGYNVTLTLKATHLHIDENYDGICDIPGCGYELCPIITENVPVTVTLESGENSDFAGLFTPKADGAYAFLLDVTSSSPFSSGGSADVILYGREGNPAYVYDGSRKIYTLEAGEPYEVVVTRNSFSSSSEKMNVKLTVSPYHLHIDENEDGVCDVPGCGYTLWVTLTEGVPADVNIISSENLIAYFTPEETGWYAVDAKNNTNSKYTSSYFVNEDGSGYPEYEYSGGRYVSKLEGGTKYAVACYVENYKGEDITVTVTAASTHVHTDENEDGVCDVPGCGYLFWITLTEDVTAKVTVLPNDEIYAYFTPEADGDYVFNINGDLSMSVYRDEDTSGNSLDYEYDDYGYNGGNRVYSLQRGVKYRVELDSYGYGPFYYNLAPAVAEITVTRAHYTSGDETVIVKPTLAAYGVNSMVCDEHGETLYRLTDPEYNDYTYGTTNDGFSYVIYEGSNGNKEAAVTGYSGSETEVTIPSEVKGVPVTSVGNPNNYGPFPSTGVFNMSPAITSVTIPEGVKSIAPVAFTNLTGLEQVTIPDSVAVIGDEAFNGCVNLAEINMGNGVKYIGKDAFSLVPDDVRKSQLENEAGMIAAQLEYIAPYIESGRENILKSQSSEFSSLSGMLHSEITSWQDVYDCIDSLTDADLSSLFGPGATKKSMKEYFEEEEAYYNYQLASVDSVEDQVSNYAAATDILVNSDGNPLERVNYSGSEEEWNAIAMGSGNNQITEAPRSYNGEGLFFATFIANGKVVAKVSFTGGQTSLAEPPVPAVPGCTGKWEKYTLGKSDITINAVYSKIYTVTFTVDGKVVKKANVAAGAKIPTPPAPTKAGYTFKGWNPKVPAKMPAKNMTFKAVFESAAKVTFEKSASVSYRTKVTITATGENLPKGTVLAIYEKGGSKPLAKGSAKSVSYEAGEMKSAKTYEVRVIDSKGNAQKGLGGEIKIDVTGTGFFQRIIAFFKYLFSPVPTKTVGPKVK